MAREKTRVTVDGTHTYEAWADPTVRWNGWLDPHFPLAEVRRMAEHFQEEMDQGYQIETVHVLDGYQYADEDGAARRVPAALVLRVRWDNFADEGPKAVATVVAPDENGLYAIGGFEWTWYQATDTLTFPLADVLVLADRAVDASPAPALWWVKDDGTYLMSSASQTDGHGPDAVFAQGYGPGTDASDILGSDDFRITYPLTGPDGTHMLTQLRQAHRAGYATLTLEITGADVAIRVYP